MYRLIPICVVAFIIASCNKSEKPTESSSGTLPRIAIAGLAIESSTFSPATTSEEAFHERTGDTILTAYSFLAIDSPDYKRATWLPALVCRAIPGGIVTKEAYESLMEKMLARLKKNLPYQGVFFDIHGAM